MCLLIPQLCWPELFGQPRVQPIRPKTPKTLGLDSRYLPRREEDLMMVVRRGTVADDFGMSCAL